MVIALLSLVYFPSVADTGVARRPADPPIRVWLNDDGDYTRGARAKVFARPAADGYLVVLRADAQGRVRVLYPLEPDADQTVKAGRKFEIKGRADRPAFAVDDSAGKGIILAAVSRTPFRFDEFVERGHWDFRALAPDPLREDVEAGLVSIVQSMAGSEPFDYDVAPYFVSDRYADAPYGAAGHPYYPRRFSTYPYSGLRPGFLFRFGPVYDRFYYGPGFGYRRFGHW